jgi:two-component system OmpR family response regulator
MTMTDALPRAKDAVECGPLWISPGEMCELRIRGRPVAMSITHLRMLAYLIHEHGRVVPRTELYEQATDKRAGPRSRTVDVQVYRIRRALGGLGKYLISVPGRGYRVDVFGLSQAR